MQRATICSFQSAALVPELNNEIAEPDCEDACAHEVQGSLEIDVLVFTFDRNQETGGTPRLCDHEQHYKNVMQFVIDGPGTTVKNHLTLFLSYVSGIKESERSCASRIFGGGDVA